MDPFYKQDIFFFITAIAVVLFTIIGVIISVYIVKIVKDIKHITKRARTEADLISEDIHDLRQNVKQEGAKFSTFMNFFQGIYKKRKK